MQITDNTKPPPLAKFSEVEVGECFRFGPSGNVWLKTGDIGTGMGVRNAALVRTGNYGYVPDGQAVESLDCELIVRGVK